jgi:hypothetical protein
MAERLYTFAYQSPFIKHDDKVIEITALINLLKRLSKQWEDDNHIYSVEIMLLFGDLIKEIHNVIE